MGSWDGCTFPRFNSILNGRTCEKRAEMLNWVAKYVNGVPFERRDTDNPPLN